MSNDDVLELLCARGVIPVVVADDLSRVRQLGDALKSAGLPVAEVTFRTTAAVDALRLLAQDPELLVGAGTVVRGEQVEVARDAGARFVVMPGFSARVVERCRAVGMPVIPGVATATEVIAALEHDVELLKFFPAEASGGVEAMRALHGPFPDVRFIPTGGVTSANAADYLRLPSVVAVGGSWMVAPALVRDGDFAAISGLASQAVAIAAGALA
ncbi:MAG: bifunctional 4-hydroxy-2-oxoglutarate aldolase/2-dehydro-3-deoxy-phosphogluconate aldolase [Solirubrobacteraceae bacterium]